MMENLKVEARSTQFGCGIYEVGTEGLRMFITDGGRVIPVQGRVITADDLIQAFMWGRMEEKAIRLFGDPSLIEAPSRPIVADSEVALADEAGVA